MPDYVELKLIKRAFLFDATLPTYQELICNVDYLSLCFDYFLPLLKVLNGSDNNLVDHHENQYLLLLQLPFLNFNVESKELLALLAEEVPPVIPFN